MARIAGVDLPRTKRIEIGLTYIYGIGRFRSNTILKAAGVSPDIRIKDLSEDDVRNISKVIEEQGKQDGRIGGQNAWPVDMLQPGDVYVCDHFGLKQDGPSIGDNVGNAIYARSHNGIVYDGAVRDIRGLNELEEFVSFVRAYDPSHHFSTSGPRLMVNRLSIGR